MCSLYENILSLCDERGIKGGKMCVDIGASKSLLTDLKSGRKKSINSETAKKIADYFGVDTDRVLFGKSQKENALTESSKSEIGFDDFTYAMQNESKGLTEEDKDLLLSMARQLKTARDKKNGGAD